MRGYTVDCEEPVWFVLPDSPVGSSLRDAEQVLTQLLERKVWITRDGICYVSSTLCLE